MRHVKKLLVFPMQMNDVRRFSLVYIPGFLGIDSIMVWLEAAAAATIEINALSGISNGLLLID